MAATQPFAPTEHAQGDAHIDVRFASAWRRAHLTVDERIARGRAARQETPRSSHSQWRPSSDRPDTVALLEEQSIGRVADLIPIRYGRMLVSPFTFFRGAA